VLRLDAIGDFVQTTPFLRALRAAAPHARIRLVVKPTVEALAKLCPYVDDGATFEGPRNPISALRQAWRTGAQLRKDGVADAVFIPGYDVDEHYSQIIAYCSGAVRRIGFADADLIEHSDGGVANSAFLTHAIVRMGVFNEASRSLQLLRPFEVRANDADVEIWWSADDLKAAEKLLGTRAKGDGRPLIAISPVSGAHALKQWPTVHFVDLMNKLTEKRNPRFVVVGGPQDRKLTSYLAGVTKSDVIDAGGKLTLPQTAALLSKCDLFIGNDSGPMHLAAGAKIRTIGLFGPSCSHRFGPSSPLALAISNELPCGPCKSREHGQTCVRCVYPRNECLWSVPPGDVANAALAELDEMAVTKE